MMNQSQPKENKKQEFIKQMFLDITLFTDVLLEEYATNTTPDFHKDIFSLVMDKTVKKKAIVAPRGHAKSTVATFITVLWNVLYERKKFIIIVSETYQQSVLFLDAIKREIEENEKLRYFFGNLISDKWAEGDMVTATGVRIMCKGAGQRMRGLRFRQWRPDLIVLDDFESEGNTETTEQRAKLFRWVNGAVLPALAPEGEIILIGTIVHNDAYLEHIRRVGSKTGWIVLYYQAIVDEEKKEVLWAERFSYKDIIRIRDEYAAQGLLDIFYMEYQNVAQDPEGRPFTEDMLQYYVGSLFKEKTKWFLRLDDARVIPVNIYIGVDPALGKVRGDFTVVMTVAVDDEGNIYIIEYSRAKTKPVALIELIFDTFMKYDRDPLLVIETTAYQEAIVDFLQAKSRATKIHVPITEVKPRNSKSQRLLSLQPYFAEHKVWIRRDMIEFVSELMQFPKSANDDTLDAFWNSIQYMTSASHTYQKIKNKIEEKYANWAVL